MTSKQTKRQAKRHQPHLNRRKIGQYLILTTLLLLVVFTGRFIYVGLGGHVDSADLTAFRKAQYAKDTVLKAKRGTILDAGGAVIAEDANTYSIYAVLSRTHVDGKKKLYVSDKARTAKALAKYLPLSEAKIRAYLDKKDVFQVEFGTAGQNLSLAIKQQIEKERLPGINFTDAPARLYPNGIFASHVIGLAQPAKDAPETAQLKGMMGLEQEFDKTLKGVNGYHKTQKDSFGYQLPTAKVHNQKAIDGGTVTTTLDSGLQSYMETLMSDVAKNYQPKALMAVLMDPKTGAIKAAAQRPTFDPSTGEGLGAMWRDTLVEDSYEPGSVMKIFTLAAAIQSGHYQPNTYFHSGSIQVGDRVIRDWDKAGWGTIPLNQAFPRSSNVGMVKIEQAMGAKTWQEYLQKFGFAKKTGITLPGETTGGYDFSSVVNQANMSFGQGIDVTAMQLLQGVTAVANRGEMVRPQLVSKVVAKDGREETFKRQVVGTPINQNTAEQVVSAMREVVNDSYGTGGAYKLPGQDVAVKTGTAQIANASGTGYLEGKYDHIYSVMGMAPAKDPKYVLYIAMRQPKTVGDSAEQVVASIFNPLMSRALAQAGGDTPAIQTATVRAVTNDDLETATQKLTNAEFTIATVGTGSRVVQQLPSANAEALKHSRVLLLTNGAMTMPDVTGWAQSDVLKLAQLTGKKFTLTGSGYATSQSLKAGSLLGESPITIQFAAK